MRLTTIGLVLGAALSLLVPAFASAQTYYYNYPYNQQYPYYNQYYGQGYYNQYPYYTQGYYPYGNQYYYGTPSCSIQYQYINNGYWSGGTYHQPVQLTWSSSNAYSAYITGIGTVNPNGQQVVYPSGNTTYTMTVQGPGGSNTCYTSYTQPVYQQYQYQYQYPYNNYQYGQYYYPYQGNQYYNQYQYGCYSYPYSCY